MYFSLAVSKEDMNLGDNCLSSSVFVAFSLLKPGVNRGHNIQGRETLVFPRPTL